MPGGDKTGPKGYGPRTGRGLGYCSEYDSPGFTRGVPRGGGGFGRGCGRGFGRGFWGRGRGFWRRNCYSDPYYGPAPYHKNIDPELSKEEEKSYLEDMVKGLEDDLKFIKEKLQELSKEKKEAP